ncbi:FtsX-like permease family protein [Nonomuraea sp. NPDC059194]|uniref:FtsX-like permease family protein n=1 Tax=Nonomuraea sp. NPDC059194 TaxID=3346764 RepID=UPI003696F853
MRGRVPLVLSRAASQPLLLLAAFGSILLATTTLVALTMYASSTAEAGVRRTVETASIRTTAATITTPVTAASFPRVERTIDEVTGRVYAGVPVALTASMRSDSYVVPGQERQARPELYRFGAYEGLQRHARLVDGAWPTADGTRVEAAVSLSAATAAGLKTGQEFTTESRIDARQRVTVRITGVFQLNDTFGERWAGEELLSAGVQVGDFTTFGPLMVSEQTFLARFATNVSATWTALPNLTRLSPERLRPFAEGVGRLQDRLRDSGCPECRATTRLPEMLTQLDTAALVARSTMLIPVLQLILLAAYALMLTARLLADHRRMEVALLRARGAGAGRLALLAGGEALLVALPCAIVAPLLGPPLLRLVDTLPWIRASGVRPAPEAGPGAFAVSAAVALACSVLLALPALGGVRRTYVDEQAARGRSGGRGLVQRAGADLALLVLAALAIWQLRHYGGPVTATAGGGIGIDPLIVAGPALALLCGGLLGLRLVPRVSALAERLTAGRAGLAAALGARQVSRRPARYAGPALLLTMAIAIGVVSMATAATWRASQEDQARHQAGADLRISGPPEARELGALGRGTAFAGLPGITTASPAFRGPATVGGEPATLMALESGKLTALLKLRSDLSEDGVREMAARLGAARPEIEAVAIPERLPLTVLISGSGRRPVDLGVAVEDGLGVWREVSAGPLRAGVNRVELDLRTLAGRTGRLTPPLRLRGFTVRASGVTVTVDPGIEMPPGLRWAARQQVTSDGGRWTLPIPATAASPAFSVVAAKGAGELFAPPRGPDPQRIFKPLPVVLTADLADRLRLTTGQVVPMNLDGANIEVKVAGVVERMPSTQADQPSVLVDWTTLQGRALAAAQRLRPATEWWLAARDGDTTAAARVLSSHPQWVATAVDLRELTVRLRDDPLAAGLQGALTLGFLAALVFAALGFLTSAAVAARERLAEFAILRALGVGFRQVFALLAIEQAFVIGLSLVAGTVLALVIGALVVPHIVLTGQAAAVTPGVLLAVPWPATALMLALVAVLLFAIVAGLARAVRGRGPGGLRAGEER